MRVAASQVAFIAPHSNEKGEHMKQLSIAICCTTLLAACSSTPDSRDGAPAASASHPAAANTQPRSSAPAASTAASQKAGGDAIAASAPGENSVYFDYDSTAVKDRYRQVVSGHARYLSNARATRVTVQGNADERGSREYNLALGQRRAEAVKDHLELLGVPEERIEAISFGEEKPRSEAPTEAGYAENRRADIVYANR
jgi:peptidoglycan-associated lipoprotein